MSGRRQLEQGVSFLERVTTWQLLLILLLALFVTATFLRLNNIGMLQRREAVLAADKEGTTDALTNRLYDLQRYASAHMNASTGDVPLQESYNREAQRLRDTALAQASQSGENIYKKIEDEVCGPLARANGWRWPDPRYINCQTEQLAKYPAASQPSSEIPTPVKELYIHRFYSPLWSPDFAGFSVLVCLALTVVIIIRLLTLLALRLVLRRYYKVV